VGITAGSREEMLGQKRIVTTDSEKNVNNYNNAKKKKNNNGLQSRLRKYFKPG